MFGIFVPINTGHLPIDFRQKMEYYSYKVTAQVGSETKGGQ